MSRISKIIGKDNTVVRYDPIFLSDKYNLDYHKRAFSKLCMELNGYISKIIVSFIDDCKNVRNNRWTLKLKDFTESDYREIGLSFSKIAKENNMTVQTCFEKNNLTNYGFVKGECLSHELAYKLTGKTYKTGTSRKGHNCNCVQMIDIGFYNSCKHFCKYCYANYNERKVLDNYQKHNKNSSLLIGELKSDDILKERRN